MSSLLAARNKLLSCSLPPVQPEAAADARDVESRTLAVASLGHLCQEIYRTPPSSSSSSSHTTAANSSNSGGDFTKSGTISSDSSSSSFGPAAAGVAGVSSGGITPSSTTTSSSSIQPGTTVSTSDQGLLESCVLPVVLTGLHDYETDNRGDVGSWVRGAAMVAAVQLFQLLVASYHSSSTQQQQQEGIVSHSDRAPQGHGVVGCIRAVESQQQRLAAWQASAVIWCSQHGHCIMPTAPLLVDGPAHLDNVAATASATEAVEAAERVLWNQGVIQVDPASSAATAVTAAVGGDGGGQCGGTSREAVAGVSLTDIAVAVVGALLQQGLGRIARLRESAINLLQELVDNEEVAAGQSHSTYRFVS